MLLFSELKTNCKYLHCNEIPKTESCISDVIATQLYYYPCPGPDMLHMQLKSALTFFSHPHNNANSDVGCYDARSSLSHLVMCWSCECNSYVGATESCHKNGLEQVVIIRFGNRARDHKCRVWLLRICVVEVNCTLQACYGQSEHMNTEAVKTFSLAA